MQRCKRRKNDCLHTTQSSSRPTAANPNYLNRVVVPIMLPKKQLYMRLGMHVFDTKYLFGKGKVTKNSSLICTAKVDVARLIEWEDLSNADVYIEHEAEAARIVLREGYFLYLVISNQMTTTAIFTKETSKAESRCGIDGTAFSTEVAKVLCFTKRGQTWRPTA